MQLQIIELYEKGLPLRLDAHKNPKLRRSVQKHFGGWRRAVESLGLGSELRRAWTEQAVIDAILHRRAAGFNLYTTRQEDAGLFYAAVSHFGTWHNALEAAGIHARVRERWSEEKVIQRLQHHAKTNPSQSIHQVDLNLVHAAARRFGSLKNAMKAAGVTTKSRRPR